MEELKYRLISVVYNTTTAPDSLDEVEKELDKLFFSDPDNLVNPDQHLNNLTLAVEGVREHIRKAEEIQRRISGGRAFTGSLAGLLEAVISPSVAIDAKGDIKTSNSRAMGLGWRSGSIVNTLKLEPEIVNDIQNFLNTAANGDVYVGTAFIECIEAKETLVVIRDLSRAMALAPRKLFLVSAIDLDFDDEILRRFGDAYKLTAAEREVVGFLVRGYSPKETATLRGTSEDTVRTQIKLIKSKVQVADIPALVRLFLGFVNTMIVPDFVVKSEVEVSQSVTSQSVKHYTLRDDRQLEVRFQGDPNGRPVLLFHNMPYGAELSQAAQQFCMKNRLLVIAPYRAGYGNSTSLKTKDEQQRLATISDDCAELLERLGIRQVVSLSYSVGTAFALDFAHRHPKFIRKQIAVSRAPIWRDSYLKSTPMRQRLMLKLVKDFPSMATLFAGSALSYLNDGKMSKFIEDSVRGCPPDELAIRDSEIFSLMQKDIEKGFRGGITTFVRECSIPMVDMTEKARACPHKFHILHGEADVIIPLSQSEDFVDEVPGTTLNVIPGAGQLMSYSHWRPILKATLEAWDS